MIERPRYIVKLIGTAGEVDRIETNGPRLLLSEAIRQKLLNDWQYLNPGDTIVVIDTHEE